MSTVAGVDLIPLPYESSVSLLLRLAYWNRLRPSDFACLGITAKRSHQTPLHLDAQGGRRLRELTHWRVDPREAWLFHLLQHTHMLLPGLRFCASCLASGYHTYFFQLACIARCPLHQEVLWNNCPCCGVGLQSDFSRRGDILWTVLLSQLRPTIGLARRHGGFVPHVPTHRRYDGGCLVTALALGQARGSDAPGDTCAVSGRLRSSTAPGTCVLPRQRALYG
ncbi:hypothetical protein OJJOAM_004589 [Cupriavidus sp. H18C1]